MPPEWLEEEQRLEEELGEARREVVRLEVLVVALIVREREAKAGPLCLSVPGPGCECARGLTT